LTSSKSPSVISNVAKWKEFLTRYYKEDIQKLAISDAKNKCLVVSYRNVTKFDVRLAEELINNPDLVIAHAEDAITLIDLPVKITVTARVRFEAMPKKTGIRDLRSCDINQLISFEGTVRKITDVRPRIIEAAFECARCKNVTYIPQEGSGKFIEPSYCQCNEEKKGVFRLLYPESRFEDFQRIKVQENPENLKGGQQPQTLDVNVTNDLAGIVMPGEHVVINGIMRSAQRINKEGKTAYFDVYNDCVMIEKDEQEFDELVITPEDEEQILQLSRDPEIYEKIIQSIAPSIYGYEDVKEAIAHQLFGGYAKHLPDGTRIRGDIHILLAGDPGIAKSQILRYVVKLAPRGVYASGKTASKAGLTAAAVKDEFDGSWSLEAGVLVLADKGVASVDEFNLISKDDQTILNEALEQQTISIAKAGILATLKARCCLLAAANPKMGRFNPYDNIPEQINLPAPLYSRFDLIFAMQDKPEEKRDDFIATHILQANTAGELIEHNKNLPNSDLQISQEDINNATSTIMPAIDPVLMRKYIAYAKRKVFPVRTPEATEELKKFYLMLRKNSGKEDSPVAITARQLEGLVRLIEARARMRLSNHATAQDAKKILNLVQISMKQVGVDPETGQFDIDVFTVGIAKSQRDRIHNIKLIVEKLSGKEKRAVPLQDILDAAKDDYNLDASKVEKELKKLKEIGELFAYSNGSYTLG